MKTAALLFLSLLVVASIGHSQTTPAVRLYLGQNPPGTTPVVFALGVVSRGNIHSRLEISPDGQEIFWNTVDVKTFSTQILCVKKVSGKWSAPQPPPFAKDGNTQAAVFSPDGKKLFFSVNTGQGWATKYVEKTEAGWSGARADGFLPNGTSSFTNSGRAYFSGQMKTKVWNTGIFGARYSSDGYADVTPLGEAINRPNSIDYTPYISPDESFLLFSSNRPLNGDKEEMFIHVSFRKSDGTWSAPQRISQIPARFPSLSPDGRYLFFCGDDGNIYWADKKILDPFRGAVSASDTPGHTQEKAAGYLQQAPPGETPRVFRLETHDGYFAGDRIASSADGLELYYTEVTNNWSDYNIRCYRYADGKWNGPHDLFMGFLGPALSTDNETMFFEKYNDARTCWHSKRTDTGWGAPTLWGDR